MFENRDCFATNRCDATGVKSLKVFTTVCARGNVTIAILRMCLSVPLPGSPEMNSFCGDYLLVRNATKDYLNSLTVHYIPAKKSPTCSFMAVDCRHRILSGEFAETHACTCCSLKLTMQLWKLRVY